MGKSILFVDDDQFYLMLITQACKKIESVAHVLQAKDGQNALELLQEAAEGEGKILPDLIFLDINMPRLDGFEFLEAFHDLKNRYPRLQKIKSITMLTSSDRDSDRKKALDLGADDYIVKPNNLSGLRSMIQECADGSTL